MGRLVCQRSSALKPASQRIALLHRATPPLLCVLQDSSTLPSDPPTLRQLCSVKNYVTHKALREGLVLHTLPSLSAMRWLYHTQRTTFHRLLGAFFHHSHIHRLNQPKNLTLLAKPSIQSPAFKVRSYPLHRITRSLHQSLQTLRLRLPPLVSYLNRALHNPHARNTMC